jgi:hypothetical protein
VTRGVYIVDILLGAGCFELTDIGVSREAEVRILLG